MKTSSEREARNYDCPLLGKPVIVSYLFKEGDVGHSSPRGVQCAGALECGVESVGADGVHVFDWRQCPLRPELVREGFLPA